MIDPRFSELIAHLWRDGKYGYLWHPKSEDGTEDAYTHWLTLPIAADFSVPKLFAGKDCYFGVNSSIIRRSERERARALDGDITVINAFYFEIDFDDEAGKQAALAHIAASPIKPACLNFSGGGLHGYVLLRASWELPTDADKARATALQRAMVKHFGGDDGAKDLARVLRVPGTLNLKPKYAPNYPTVTIEQWDMSIQYDLAEIEPYLQPIIDKEASRQAAQQAHTPHTPSGGTVSLSDSELLDVLFKSKNGSEYEALYRGDLTSAGDDHSKADQKLCNGLAWLTGRDLAAMDRLFRQSQLYRPKWETRSYRERTLNNAANTAQTVYTPSQIDPQAVHAAQSAVNMNGNSNNGATGSQPSGSGQQAQQAAASGGAYKAPNDPHSDDYIKSLNSLGYYFRLNDLDNSVEVNGQAVDDVIAAEIRTQMRDLGYKGRHISAMEDAYLAHAGKNRYHPIRDYLQSLQWDGDDHVRLLSRYFQDKHTPVVYGDGRTETVLYVWLKRWLVGAVAKIFASGTVKAQNSVLVLEGGQNLGKSTFASWLCSGMPHYFIEQAVEPENKEHERFLAGKWIWEIGEMGSTTRKADRESLKNFLTKSACDFRTPYAKKPIKKPALASFIGTVNNEGGFLQDATGTRRFMTVGLARLDHAYINDLEIDQVWAQAFALYQRGESWRLLPEEVQARDELNGDYKVEDAYEGWIKRYFDIDLARADAKTAGWFTTTQEIVSELKNQGVTGDTQAITMRLASTMKELGLEKSRLHKPSGPRGYWGIKVKP